MSGQYFQVYTKTLAANEAYRIAVNGEFVFVRSATGALRLTLDAVVAGAFGAGSKYRAPYGEKFSLVTVEDTSGATNTVTLIVGVGDFDDAALIIGAGTSVAVADASLDALKRGTGLGTRADITLNNGALTSFGAPSANTREQIVVADPANTVDLRIGDANVTASRGALLRPGAALVLNTNATVHGWATAAGQKVSLTDVTD
jgi:hypothetical protein